MLLVVLSKPIICTIFRTSSSVIRLNCSPITWTARYLLSSTRSAAIPSLSLSGTVARGSANHPPPADLRPRGRVDALLRRPLAAAQVHDGPGCRQGHVVARAQVVAGGVRRHDHVLELPQRMHPRRLLLE